MAKQTQLRRGTAAEQAAFAGAIGEVSVNTTDNRLAVHNGSKLGGFPAIHENGDKGLDLTLTGNVNLTAKNITLKDSTLDSSLSISSSGIRMRDSSIDRFVIDDASFYIKDNSNIPIQNNRTFYNSASESVLDINNSALYYNGGAVLDWAAQGLYDTSFFPSLGWSERQLYSNNGSVDFVVCNWGNNTLYRNNNGTSQLAVNWSGCELRDKNGILSQDWNARKLFKSDGSTAIIDWENSQLLNDGIASINWSELKIKDYDGINSIDYGARKLHNSSNVEVCNWENTTLNDLSVGNNSINWTNRTLKNGSAIILDWNNRILSGAWNGNYLILNNYIRANTAMTDSLISSSDGGDTWFDMVNNVINYNGDEVLSWDSRILSGIWTSQTLKISDKIYNINGDESIDTNGYKLYDSTPAPSLDWNNHNLINGGDTVLNWELWTLNVGAADARLDWFHRTLSGNWTSEKLTANTGIFNNKVGIAHIRPNYQLDVLGTGAFQSVLITGFSLAPATSTSPGIKGQIATSGAFFFVATGNNLWGRTTLSNW